jgi:5-methylcytosine-specific restriction protein A
MTRTVPEWFGKTDDTKVPDRVKRRVFLRWGGTCHISTRKIGPADLWDLDHFIPLANGGKHCESNLRPALKAPHKAKTKAEAAERKVDRRKEMKAMGIKKKPKRPMIGSRDSEWKAKVGGGWERR